jgi:hypothetical protein
MAKDMFCQPAMTVPVAFSVTVTLRVEVMGDDTCIGREWMADSLAASREMPGVMSAWLRAKSDMMRN